MPKSERFDLEREIVPAMQEAVRRIGSNRLGNNHDAEIKRLIRKRRCNDADQVISSELRSNLRDAILERGSRNLKERNSTYSYVSNMPIGC